MANEINELMRDFNKWNNANPLPIGDPASGAYAPTKKDLRDWATAIQLETEAGSLLNTKITTETAQRISADNAEADARVAGDQNAINVATSVSASNIVGEFDASSGAFPSTVNIGGVTRAVQAKDAFRVSVAGTVGGKSFVIEDTITAIKAAPSTSVYAGNWQIGKGSLILKAADIRPFLTEAAMLAATDVVANQRAQVAGREWIYKPLGTYTASPTVKTGAAFQLVSTSLEQPDCTFAQDTRPIAFLRSVHGSSATVEAVYKDGKKSINLAVNTSGNVKSLGNVFMDVSDRGRVSLDAMGLKLDGTDESAAAQAAFDKLKGRKILIPAGKTLCAAGIYLNGSSWDGTDLLVEGEFKLAPASTVNANNGSGLVWTGIEAKGCDFTVNGNFNGDRLNQQDREQTIMITQAGGYLRSDLLNFKELRGDGCYITQENFNTLSADPSFDLGDVIGENSAYDGRNMVTVISCEYGRINRFVSRNIGGFVGSGIQPGGLDFEPNYSGQKVRNVTVGYVDIEGIGGSPLQIYGSRYDTTGHTTLEPEVFDANIHIGYARIVNHIPANINDGNGNLTQTNRYGCLIEGARNVSIGFLDVEFTQAYGLTLGIRNGCEDIYIKGRGKKSQVADFGTGVSTLNRISKNLNVDFDIDDISRYGNLLGLVTESKIKGRLTNPKTAYYSTRFGVVVERPIPLVDLTPISASLVGTDLSHDIPANANWTRAWRHGGDCDYTNARIIGSKQNGTWADQTAKVGDMQIAREGAKNVTDSDALPSGGYWLKGTVVRNRLAGTAGQPESWIRMTNGTSNTLGTDWLATGESAGPTVFTQATTYSDTLLHTATDETQVYSGTLTGAKVGDFIDVALVGNSSNTHYRGEIVSANLLRIYGICRGGTDVTLSNPSFKVRWQLG